MDEIYFEDPRNARLTPMATRLGVAPLMRPPVSRPFPYATAQPAYAQPAYAQPVVMTAQPYGTPSKLRTRLGDLTVGDLVPLLAQIVVALRPMPVAPADTRDTAANLVNQTKFIEAIAGHFHGDAQLNAAGAVAGKLLG